MKITLAKTAGFCFGVDRAVNMVYELAKKDNSIFTLGPIIHNPQVVSDLKSKGVGIIDLAQEAKKGDTVVIRSHGVERSAYDVFAENQIDFVDATCPFVAKIHKIVFERSQQGDIIIIAGDKNHPEVLGIMGHSLSPTFVVKNHDELCAVLDELQENLTNNITLVAQTTYNMEYYKKCIEIIKKLYTNVNFFDTICNATNERQTEALKLSKANEVMIVIGGKESSNTKKLKDVCSENAKTYLIETKDELLDIPLIGYENIGVTAGASTPAHIIKEVLETMSEMLNNQVEEMGFEQLLEQSFQNENEKLYNGKRVKGYVIKVVSNEVHVDIGAKQTGIVPADELTDNPELKASDVVAEGDEINLIVLKVNDQEGVVTLSKKRCDAMAGFEEIKKAYDDGVVLDGIVTNVVKGGVLVLANHIKVFVPASQVSDKRIENLETLLKTEVKFKILEVNERRGRALGSIRAVLTEGKKELEEKFWAAVEVGQIYKGEVKSLTQYGAFVDLGGVDGMIHITELAWTKVRHPSEVVSVGDIVEVYVKDLDTEKHRISLGYKKSQDNPWEKFKAEYSVDDVVTVKVVSFTNYGAFAVIIPGVDGLIHISQIANKRVEKIADILEVGQEVQAKIIEINLDSKRVSLSMRALLPQEDQKDNKEAEDGVVYSSEDGVVSEEMEAAIEAENATEE